jgi:hypothetical protein
MGTGDVLRFQTGNGCIDPGTPEKVDYRDGFDLFKSGCQYNKNFTHVLFLALMIDFLHKEVRTI